MIKVRRCHHQSQLPLPLASFGDALPVMAVSYVSAVVHQPQIASSVVQAVAVYMIAFFALLHPPAQDAFQDLSMQRDAFAAFAASSIKSVVAHRAMPRNSMPRSPGQVDIGCIDYGVFASGQFN